MDWRVDVNKTKPGFRLLVLLPLFCLLLACRALSVPFQDPPVPSATAFPEVATSVFALPSPSDTPLPTRALTSTPLPAATLTLTPQPTSTQPATQTPSIPSATPLSQELQVAIFDELWTIVRDDYLYSDFNGLDWDAIHSEYRQKIEAGLTDEEFYLTLDEMIARLGDDHSVYLDPQQASAEDAEYQGNLNFVGVGVIAVAVPERDRAVVLVTFPGGSAEEAGLKPRDSILAADGTPILDENGFLRDIVRGPEGTQVTLTVQTPGEKPRDIPMLRRRVTGSIPLFYTILTSPEGQRIGYISLVTFSDGTIDDQVELALSAMTVEAPLDGLIIDNSQNSGGADTVLRPMLSYFTSGVLGHFVSRAEERPLEVKGVDINGSSEVPLVILIGPDTVSYGEVFAGVLKDIGRAYLIGETTEGNIETLWGYDFDDGSRAWIAHETFRPLNHPDQDWEETGIIPDLALVSNWDEYTLETDPAVLAALEYLDKEAGK